MKYKITKRFSEICLVGSKSPKTNEVIKEAYDCKVMNDKVIFFDDEGDEDFEYNRVCDPFYKLEEQDEEGNWRIIDTYTCGSH